MEIFRTMAELDHEQQQTADRLAGLRGELDRKAQELESLQTTLARSHPELDADDRVPFVRLRLASPAARVILTWDETR